MASCSSSQGSNLEEVQGSGKSSIFFWIYEPAVVYCRVVWLEMIENEQLTQTGRGECRLGIYEPEGGRKTLMRLAINNLHRMATRKARSWIYDRPSHNHS